MRAVKRDIAGMREPEHPIGSFLFVGPSGVGKTELARRLAAALGVPLHRFDMSEYMEKHTASRLIGAPPGYVGHESGGLLTDAVIKAPHSVILLDEVEKAHPDIFDLLLQIMDYAALTDGEGRSAHFQHTVLLMTSNAGSRDMAEPSVGFATGADDGRPIPAATEGEKAVKRLFRPEFINRLDAIVTFDPLGPEVVEQIVDRLLADLATRLRARRVTVTLTAAARSSLAARGLRPGGRRPPACAPVPERGGGPLDRGPARRPASGRQRGVGRDRLRRRADLYSSPSIAISSRLRHAPLVNPPSLPPAATARWQGMINGTGLAPHAPPTARAAPGRPSRAAICP